MKIHVLFPGDSRCTVPERLLQMPHSTFSYSNHLISPTTVCPIPQGVRLNFLLYRAAHITHLEQIMFFFNNKNSHLSRAPCPNKTEGCCCPSHSLVAWDDLMSLCGLSPSQLSNLRPSITVEPLPLLAWPASSS